MNSSLQKALSHLTGQQNIDDVSVKFLEGLVVKYPYFPIGHILLSNKLKTDQSEQYLEQVRKTALYFNSPYWLYYQLATDIPEVVFDDNTGNNHTPAFADRRTEDDLQITPDQFHPEAEELQEEMERGEAYVSDAGTKQHALSEMPESTTTLGEEVPAVENAAVHTEAADNTNDSFEDDSSIEVPKAVSISEEELQDDENLLHEIAHTHEPDAQDDVPDAPKKTPSNGALEERVTDALEGHNAFSKEMEERTRALVHPPDISNPEDEHLISYEPYHTIDYFASQGIQLVLENNPQDKLGKQLKKFTQWLKHMKRLGPEDALNAVKDSHLENTIQEIADSSNTPRDVVTETMASILEKQGKTEKALALYTKLTFLNPDKSAYFADKIKQLKEI